MSSQSPLMDQISNAVGSALDWVKDKINNPSQGNYGGGKGKQSLPNLNISQINWSDNKCNYTEIMGLPPSFYYDPVDQGLILKSMPVVELQPGWPQLAGSSSLTNAMGVFTFDPIIGEKKYKQIIKSVNIFNRENVSLPLKFAYLNDVSIEESWSSDYGEMIGESLNNMANETLSNARYGSGAGDLKEALDPMIENMGGVAGNIDKATGGALSNMMGMDMGTAAAGAKNAASAISEGASKLSSALGGSPGAVGKIMSGSKVDFPMMWKGSSYSPSYGLTIRLYNPVPASDEAYIEYILKPLTYLLAFMTPMSDTEFTFTFPVLCSVRCPGLFQIKAGYVSNISVIKGGENNDISFVQRPGSIDVRITFSELYTTMIAQTGGYKTAEDRPTLSSYIDNLMTQMNTPDLTRPVIETDTISYASQLLADSKIQTVPIGNSPYNPANYNGQYHDDELGHSRTPVGLNQSDADINIDKDDPNYPSYEVEKNSISSDEYYTEDHNVALMVKYGLTDDEILIQNFYANYENIRENDNGLLDSIMGEDFLPEVSGEVGGAGVEQFYV